MNANVILKPTSDTLAYEIKNTNSKMSQFHKTMYKLFHNDPRAVSAIVLIFCCYVFNEFLWYAHAAYLKCTSHNGQMAEVEDNKLSLCLC